MIYARPGTTFTAIFEGAPTGLVGTLGVRIENTDGSNQTPRTTDGIVELEADSGAYSASLTAPDARSEYVVIWDTGDSVPTFASEELLVAYNLPVPPSAGFANTGDVENRLGRSLSEPESRMAEYVIGVVTGLIIEAAEKNSDWADALDPVPTFFRSLCVEKVIATLVNPGNIASETLGQHSTTFPRSLDGGVRLTYEEEHEVRRLTVGITASAVMTSDVLESLPSPNDGTLMPPWVTSVPDPDSD